MTVEGALVPNRLVALHLSQTALATLIVVGVEKGNRNLDQRGIRVNTTKWTLASCCAEGDHDWLHHILKWSCGPCRAVAAAGAAVREPHLLRRIATSEADPQAFDQRRSPRWSAPANAHMGDAASTPPAIDPRVAAFSGAMSGALASIATHPLDVVRTKLAVQRQLRGGEPPRYKGTFGTLRRVFREEGLRGLFRGITPAVVSHAPAAAIFFSTYSFLKIRVPDVMTFPALPRDVSGSSWAAGGGWVTTCLLLNPLFVVKTKQQTQLVRASQGAPLKYTGLLSSFRIVVSEQGLRGLYAGTAAAMAGFPGAMVQMPLYEYLKRSGDSDPPSHFRVAVSSACSASCVGIIMYPIEVVRLRLQAQGPAVVGTARYTGIFDAFRKIYSAEGIHAFHRGLSTGLIRTVPQSAIGLSCYEAVLRISSAVLEMWGSEEQEGEPSLVEEH